MWSRAPSLALSPLGNGHDEAQRFVEAEVKRWGELIRNANIQPD